MFQALSPFFGICSVIRFCCSMQFSLLMLDPYLQDKNQNVRRTRVLTHKIIVLTFPFNWLILAKFLRSFFLASVACSSHEKLSCIYHFLGRIHWQFQMFISLLSRRSKQIKCKINCQKLGKCREPRSITEHNLQSEWWQEEGKANLGIRKDLRTTKCALEFYSCSYFTGRQRSWHVSRFVS